MPAVSALPASTRPSGAGSTESSRPSAGLAILWPCGRYIGPIGMFVRAQLLARRPGPKIVIPHAKPTMERLEELADLMQSGAQVSVIDRVFTLDDAGDAVWYVETDHSRGKVVIVVDRADLDPLELADREDPSRKGSVMRSADTDLTPLGGRQPHTPHGGLKCALPCIR